MGVIGLYDSHVFVLTVLRVLPVLVHLLVNAPVYNGLCISKTCAVHVISQREHKLETTKFVLLLMSCMLRWSLYR